MFLRQQTVFLESFFEPSLVSVAFDIDEFVYASFSNSNNPFLGKRCLINKMHTYL